MSTLLDVPPKGATGCVGCVGPLAAFCVAYPCGEMLGMTLAFKEAAIPWLGGVD